MSMESHTLDTDGATIAYDVRAAATPSGHRPLVMIGQPMTAEGFTTLASHFTDRVVVTYDQRGLGRSTRTDGHQRQVPATSADDLHRLGVADGDVVKVTSARGSLATPVRPDATVPPGTVVLLWNTGDPSPTALIDASAAVTEVRVETT